MGRIIRVGSGPPIPAGNTNMGFRMTKLAKPAKPGERPVGCPECPEVGTEHIIVGDYDGYMHYSLDGDWDDCRNAASALWMSDILDFLQIGVHVIAYAGGYYYSCVRAFLSFDLGSIPDGVVRYASLVVSCKSSLLAQVGVAILEGMQHRPLQLSDYSAFGTDLLSATVGRNDGSYDYHFDALGRAYLQSKIGSVAKLCSREYYHDYFGVAPPGDQDATLIEDWGSSRESDESKRPYLVIGF